MNPMIDEECMMYIYHTVEVVDSHQDRILLGASIIRRDDRFPIETHLTSILSFQLLFATSILLLFVGGNGQLL